MRPADGRNGAGVSSTPTIVPSEIMLTRVRRVYKPLTSSAERARLYIMRSSKEASAEPQNEPRPR